MTNWRNETEEQWRLQVAKAEAWDEGYHAARQDWIIGSKEVSTNPYDKLATIRLVVNEENRPVKTPRSVVQEIRTYD